jgi:hypothetical protein
MRSAFDTGPARERLAMLMTNANVYLAIAEDAQAESERLAKLARRPKPDGEPGVIVTYDPDQKSFKSSLITIVFSTMHLEALLYIIGTKKFGSVKYNKEHDRKCLEDKLPLFDLTANVFYAAQDEAKHAIALVKTITERLGLSKSKP